MTTEQHTQVIDRRQEDMYIDANRAGKPFPHFWEKAFGSCHACITLAEDWRKDVDTLKRIVDVKHIRFHGIFDKETGIYGGDDEKGNLLLNFTRIDQIYDGLLAHGVRPFVELSFMPPAMGDDIDGAVHPFKYHPIVAPPKNPAKWFELIQRFADHLVKRYGIQEVSSWYFEVWNEPNIDFLAGDSKEAKQRAYFMMYDLAAHALKSVDSSLKVGGPATAMAAWIPDFLAHCALNQTPVDFVSTHIYPNEDPVNVFGEWRDISQKDMVVLAVQKIHGEVKASAYPDLPIFWTEFNAGFDGLSQTDLPYAGPWLATTIARCDGLVTEMSYWTFTDNFFEEGGVFQRPFSGGFGLIATGSIPKAPFNAFKVLHLLGEERLPIASENAILTRRKDGSVVLAIWNYVAPKESGNELTFDITLSDAGNGLACVHTVDETHGNPLNAWNAMGCPNFPTPEQQQKLRQAAQLPAAEVVQLKEGKLSVTAQPNALIVIQFISLKKR
ncbi:MAG: glycosyl hydrolase [Candidatus Obscuribacterales bacterium]|nr:glycosyl hydrolase [Candidatus Obscuribacterales bacterium]